MATPKMHLFVAASSGVVSSVITPCFDAHEPVYAHVVFIILVSSFLKQLGVHFFLHKKSKFTSHNILNHEHRHVNRSEQMRKNANILKMKKANQYKQDYVVLHAQILNL